MNGSRMSIKPFAYIMEGVLMRKEPNEYILVQRSHTTSIRYLFSDINASTMLHSHTIALNNYSSDFLHSLSVTVVVYHYYHYTTICVCVLYWLGNLILAGGPRTQRAFYWNYQNPWMSVCIYLHDHNPTVESSVIYLTKIDWLSPMASYIYIVL